MAAFGRSFFYDGGRAISTVSLTGCAGIDGRSLPSATTSWIRGLRPRVFKYIFLFNYGGLRPRIFFMMAAFGREISTVSLTGCAGFDGHSWPSATR